MTSQWSEFIAVVDAVEGMALPGGDRQPSRAPTALRVLDLPAPWDPLRCTSSKRQFQSPMSLRGYLFSLRYFSENLVSKRYSFCSCVFFFAEINENNDKGLTDKKIVKTPTQCQLNNNSTKVGFDIKMTLQTTPPTPPHKLNVCNISAVTDPILTKL